MLSRVNGPDGLPVQWGDTYAAFVGNVNGSEPGVVNYDKVPGWGAFSPVVASVARSFGVPADDRARRSHRDRYGEIAHGFVQHGFTTLTRRAASLYPELLAIVYRLGGNDLRGRQAQARPADPHELAVLKG